MNTNSHSIEAIRESLVFMLNKELRVESIDPDKLLTQYGLDSISALTVAGELEDMLGLELPTTLLWDCPTVNHIADYLVDLLGQKQAIAV
jgi:acyl carrier protein